MEQSVWGCAGQKDVEAAYRDVNPSNWYVNEINELTEKEIISGDRVTVCDGYARSASCLLDKIEIENDYPRQLLPPWA